MKTHYSFFKVMLLLAISTMVLFSCNQKAKKTESKSMVVELEPGLSLGIASIPNLRDLGGYKTKDNRIIASGMLFRSNQISHISAGDMEKLAALGLKNSFDLRTEGERTSRPDELSTGVNYVVLDVLADAQQSDPAVLEKLLKNPAKAFKLMFQKLVKYENIQMYLYCLNV